VGVGKFYMLCCKKERGRGFDADIARVLWPLAAELSITLREKQTMVSQCLLLYEIAIVYVVIKGE